MRCVRLILEAGSNNVTVAFHPGVTVVAGVGPAERDGLLAELVGALTGGRGGAHVEVVWGDGRRLAVVRPADGSDRVLDLATGADVTDELRGPAGAVDLLARLGVPRAGARRRLRLRADDLQVEERGDQLVARLVGCPQQLLWRAATNVRDAEAWVAAEAERAGTAPEDAGLVAEVETRHAVLEAAQAAREQVRHLAIFVGGACAVAAVPAALLIRWTALPFLLVALATTALSVVRRRAAGVAEAREREALEQVGAASYRGFHLQRVEAVLASSTAEHRLVEAADAHRAALVTWRRLAGDVDVGVALRLKGRVSAAVGGVDDDHDDRRPVAGGGVVAGAGAVHLARALTTRLAQQRRAGIGGEALPLVLDEPFEGLPAPVVRELLELVLGTAGVQVILLTADPAIAAWAQQRAATGRCTVLSPGPDPARVRTTAPAATLVASGP